MTTYVEEILAREELLIGQENIERLKASHVAVCGVGGVGSYLAEALARCGIGRLTLVDFDSYAASNMNRQLHALHSTLGQVKVEVLASRIADINPLCQVRAVKAFISADNAAELIGHCDYIADAIDSIAAKVALIHYAYRNALPIISAMGAGRRLDPTQLRVADISETSICPLARIMRRELRKVGIASGVRVVFSEEAPRRQLSDARGEIGSMVFVPAAMGMLMAAEVVRSRIVLDE